MVWHYCTQQMAAHGKGTKLTHCATGGPRTLTLSDPHCLPMEFPQFGHCRGVIPGRVFQPATKPPGIKTLLAVVFYIAQHFTLHMLSGTIVNLNLMITNLFGPTLARNFFGLFRCSKNNSLKFSSHFLMFHTII